MAGKIDSISINVGNGEQLSTWPDGNRMNEPDLNEGQEIKQGGVVSSQKVWELLADGLGQESHKFTRLCAGDSGSRDFLLIQSSLPLPASWVV